MKLQKIQTRLILSFAVAVLLGTVIALLSPGSFVIGWLGSSLLFWVSGYFLLTAWNWAGAEKSLLWMVVLAFMLRLGVGILTTSLLPEYGFDTEQQNSGYLFFDSFRRDVQSWDLAQSNQPVWASFGEDFTTDQYGGLLALSAGVYRYLSPDEHRPYLILILCAFVAALGVPFLWKAVNGRWNRKLANLTAWIYVLYPDGILFSASQMREPFLIGLICIAFWAVLVWEKGRKDAGWAFGLSILSMGLISSRVTAMALVVFAVLFWAEKLVPRYPLWKKLGWILLALAGILVAVGSWSWLQSASSWDTLVTEAGSGWVQKSIEEIGTQFRLPFIAVYGLTQPVLPAAIAYPTLAIWKTIAIFRALGWYLIAPLLFYSLITVWKVKPVQERRVLVWMLFFVVVWILVSSIRAGGDQWDNPRYRMIFIPWMSLLAAWSVRRAVEEKDWWLARWLIVEGIFLYYFTQWYFSRYFLLWKRLPFWQNVVRIVVLSAVVLGSGWLWDLYKRLTSGRQKSKRLDV